MKPFTPSWTALSERINSLTPRERVILFVTGLVLVWGLMDSLLLGPLEGQRETLSGRLAELGTRADSAGQALATLSARPDKVAEAQARRTALEQELNTRMQATAALGDRLISAKDMPRVLEGLLTHTPGLRLLALNTLAPEPIGQTPGQASPEAGATPPAETTVAKEGTTAAFYRHGVELTLEGDYAALTAYLERLERAPLGVLWAKADLDALDHPHLRLTLVVYTLSENRTWLKV